MTIGPLIIGVLWFVGFLVLTAVRGARLNPPVEGRWPWPVWIAIASPAAAALAPLWFFLLVGSWFLGYQALALILFGPLLLTAVAGVIGVLMSLGKKST